MAQNFAVVIRTKKLGVLLRDARTAAGRTMKECGQAINVSGAMIGAYERGDRAPSLPELEMLAFYLDIPIEHFWQEEIISDDPHPSQDLDAQRLLTLRHRIIGALVRQERQNANISMKDLAEELGISPGTLRKYEAGDKPIPVPELEAIGRMINYPIRQLTNHSGPVGDWIAEQRAVQSFLELPDELVEFVSKPINRPYLELALRLSEMSVDKLREVAEGLLEITL